MKKARLRGAVPLGLLASFIAGAAIDGWLRTYGPPQPAQPVATDTFLAAPPSRGSDPDSRAPSAPVAPSRENRDPTPTAGTTGDLPRGRLRLPIDGETLDALRGGFAERRGRDRPHEAVDILAPRNTPVHAVDNGTIAKLFTSKAGGLTIYQFNPDGRLCYYYAHLERYADDLRDGQTIARGEVIGYVGTTGNAPPNTPHLHFAVFEMNADKRWWQGRPIDPYVVFKQGLGAGN